MRSYDVIVIGIGGMGSAVLYHLARRGRRALGIEQFAIGHDRGSSHGQTRIIRESYFEHPDYVPLVRWSYDAWRALEADTGTPLVRRTGLLLVGAAGGPLVQGVRRAAAVHGFPLHDVDLRSGAAGLSGFAGGPGLLAMLDSRAGCLQVEAAVSAHVTLAKRCGAGVLEGQSVKRWEADAQGITVHTASERYHAAGLVICGGAWNVALLEDLALPLVVRRKVLLWYEVGAAYHADGGCPMFAYDLPQGFFYGFPVFDRRGMKVGEHSGGAVVGDPAAVDRRLHDPDRRPFETFAAGHLTDWTGVLREHAVCLYTMTPDEHFIIDRHPHHANVHFAAGFSGHGFKFAPLVGAALTDLAIEGRTDHPIGFLGGRRFLH